MECSLFNKPAMSHTVAANRRVVYSMNPVTLNCVLLLDKPNTSLNSHRLVGDNWVINMVVFVVETSEGDDFAMRRNFYLKMLNLDACSLAIRKLQLLGHVPPFLLPNTVYGHFGIKTLRHWCRSVRRTFRPVPKCLGAGSVRDISAPI